MSVIDVDDVVIEGLVVDGNKNGNGHLNGCRGGAIHIHKTSRTCLRNCTVRDFDGDCIC